MDKGYQVYLNNEEQKQCQWEAVENSERIFDECNNKIKTIKCAARKQRTWAELDYEANYTTNVIIRKACCMSLAKTVGHVFLETKVFDSVSVNCK